MKQLQVAPSAKKTAPFFLFLVISAGLAYLLTSGIENNVDPVSLLPDNTALLVDLKEPVPSIIRFRGSRLGRQIAAVPWQEVLEETGRPKDDIRKFLNRIGVIEKIIKSPLFSELFVRRALLGLVPVPETEEGQAGRENPIDMMVFIVRPRHRALFVVFFSRYLVGEMEYAQQPYKGRIIKAHVFDDDLTLFTAVANGLIVASFSLSVVKRCIDTSISNMITGQSGFQANKTYDQLRKKSPWGTDLFAYMDFRKLKHILYRGSGSRSYSLEELPVQSAAIYWQPRKNILSLSAILQYNSDYIRRNNSFLQNYQPGTDTTFVRLPDDIFAHFWTNVFDMKALWGFVQDKTNCSICPHADTFEAWLLENTGMSVENVLSLFGSEVSLNVTEIKTSGFLLIPSIYLRIQVINQEKVKNLLGQIFADLCVQQSVVGNKDVFTVMLAGGLIQPSYMFSDGFLVIADSRRQLEKILTQDGKSLVKAPRFQKIDVGLAEKNNLTIYCRDTALIEGVKELLLWYGSLLPLYGRNSRLKNKVIVEKVFIPVLEGMKMYRGISLRAYTTGSEIIMQSALVQEKGTE